jgi:hypothetical protein
MRWSENTPVWEAGDVVDVIFRRQDGTTNGQYYRYTRDDTHWPGVQRGGWSDRYDADIDALFMTGDARVICENVDMPYDLTIPEPLPQEFWLCWDESGHRAGAVFAEEIEALRWAVEHDQKVMKKGWGELW